MYKAIQDLNNINIFYNKIHYICCQIYSMLGKLIKVKKSFHLILVLFLLVCCKEEEEPIVDNLEPPATARHTIAGYVQKGPFINGTTITIAELDDSLRATGKNFSTQINDNKGSFSLEDIELASSNVQLTANGFYFDEVKGEKSLAQLTLTALANIAESNHINVNVLSHLTKDRILYLIKQGKTFTEAKKQSQQEVLAIFSIAKEDIASAELLDISQEGEDNAILLAISAILQADNAVAELSELLANIITDIREDGKLDDQAVQEKLVKQSVLLQLPQIRTHLEKRYEELKVNANIANFEKYADSDGDGILNKDEDDTPDEFTFTIQKDIAVSTEITSNEITIAGLKAGGYAEAPVQKAKLMLNDVILTDTLAKVKNGDKIKLLLTSSSHYADTVVANLTVGYLTSYFTVVTDDYKPDSFSFTAQKDVAVDSFYTSNTITVSGLPYATPATVEKGILIKNAVELKADTTSVKNGDKLAIRLRSSEVYATAVSSILDINGIAAAFEITTDDYKPNDFSFTPVENAKRDSLYTSETITLSGLLYPTPVSLDQGTLLINGQTVNDPNATVKNGDRIAVIGKASTSFLSVTNTLINIGNASYVFKITTIPNPFRKINSSPDDFRNYPPVVGFTIKDKLYVVNYLRKLYEYDIASEKWTQKASFPGPDCATSSSFSLNEKGYLCLGRDTDNYYKLHNELWEYDPATDTWLQKTSFPGSSRHKQASFTANGKAYIGFGETESSKVLLLNDLWQYDPTTDTWTQKSDFPGGKRTEAFTLSFQDKAYLGGGWSESTEWDHNYLHTYFDFWQYDPLNDNWTQKNNIEFIPSSYFVIDDTGYITSHYSYPFETTGLLKYNPETDKWTKIESYFLGVRYTIENKAYGPYSQGVNEFTPPQE